MDRANLQAMPYIKHITGIGLARGIPNWTGGRASHTAFAPIFKKCAALGLRLTAHAGRPSLVLARNARPSITDVSLDLIMSCQCFCCKAAWSVSSNVRSAQCKYRAHALKQPAAVQMICL